VSSRAPLRALTIGAVLRVLRAEFPDITVSKIRFLESEGLVSPTRTASGYRTYTDEDVERLRYVLAAQRDRFLPLRVIRQSLEAIDRGLEPDEVAPGTPGVRPQPPRPKADRDVPTAADLARSHVLRLSPAELAETVGLDPDTVAALEGFGLLRPEPGGHYGETALTIAHTAKALAAFGLEPRHLRPFRTAADREIGVLEQVIGPLRRNARGTEKNARDMAKSATNGATRSAETSTAKGADPAAEVLRLCLALHVALVKADLGPGSAHA
jgi:DNA-binding transcriptional MerR regulator